MKQKVFWLISSYLMLAVLVLVSCTPSVSEEEDETQASIDTETTSVGVIYKSGWITEDESWSGKVHISGDVWVDEAATLTIMPGTQILFNADGDDQNAGGAAPQDEWVAQHDDPTWTLEYAETHCKLDVYGTLVARGTPENLIIFTSASLTPDAGDWTHIYIGRDSIVEYCVIEYARVGIDIMENTGDTVTVSHNIIRNTLWGGVGWHNGSAPTVTYNEISHCGGHQGIGIAGGNIGAYVAYNYIEQCRIGILANPEDISTIEYNTLVDNHVGITARGSSYIHNNVISSPSGVLHDFTYKGKPVYFSSVDQYSEVLGILVNNSSPHITNNKISECPTLMGIIGNSSPNINNCTFKEGKLGILFGSSFNGSAVLNNNNFYDNSIHIGLEPGFDGLIDAGYNWWGTVDSAELVYLIRDSRYNPSLGTVIYEPFLTQQAELFYFDSP